MCSGIDWRWDGHSDGHTQSTQVPQRVRTVTKNLTWHWQNTNYCSSSSSSSTHMKIEVHISKNNYETNFVPALEATPTMGVKSCILMHTFHGPSTVGIEPNELLRHPRLLLMSSMCHPIMWRIWSGCGCYTSFGERCHDFLIIFSCSGIPRMDSTEATKVCFRAQASEPNLQTNKHLSILFFIFIFGELGQCQLKGEAGKPWIH